MLIVILIIILIVIYILIYFSKSLNKNININTKINSESKIKVDINNLKSFDDNYKDKKLDFKPKDNAYSDFLIKLKKNLDNESSNKNNESNANANVNQELKEVLSQTFESNV